MASAASLLGARHFGRLWRTSRQVRLLCPWASHLRGHPTFTSETGNPEIETPKRVRTYRPKHSDTSLSGEWRIYTVNKKILGYCSFKPLEFVKSRVATLSKTKGVHRYLCKTSKSQIASSLLVWTNCRLVRPSTLIFCTLSYHLMPKQYFE